MDIAAVDYWASCHTSFLHRASTPAKLLAAALLLAAVLLSRDPFVLLALYLAVAAAVVATRLPARRILALAAYPALFALLFAVARWDGSLVTPAVIILKALASALTVIAVVVTTPSPRLFAAARPVLPGAVAEALFLTYRSLFILLELLDHLLTALRLRGGLWRRRYLQNGRNLSLALSLLLVRGTGLAERLYDVRRLRGHPPQRGHAPAGQAGEAWRPHDLLPIALAAALLAAATAMRLIPPTTAFNGYLLLLAALALGLSILRAARAHPPRPAPGERGPQGLQAEMQFMSEPRP